MTRFEMLFLGCSFVVVNRLLVVCVSEMIGVV